MMQTPAQPFLKMQKYALLRRRLLIVSSVTSKRVQADYNFKNVKRCFDFCCKQSKMRKQE